MNTSAHGLSHTAEIPEQSEIDSHQKCFGELCLHFQLDLSTLAILSVHPQHLVRMLLGYTSKTSGCPPVFMRTICLVSTWDTQS